MNTETSDPSFKIGDRVEVIATGRFGTVVSIEKIAYREFFLVEFTGYGERATRFFNVAEAKNKLRKIEV